MQNQLHLQVLSFGCSDPLGAIGIQADLGSFTAMGCHGLTVITAILSGDTTQITSIEPIDADLVVEQARTILEDVPVHAFKIGTIGSVENVSAIAEIVADYPEIPLIFDPFSSSIPSQDQITDDIFLAIGELIIPQTTLFVASAVEIARLAEAWRESSSNGSQGQQGSQEANEANEEANESQELSEDSLTNGMQQIIDLGCEYVLVNRAATSATEITNYLYDQTGIIRKDVRPRLSGSFLGAGTTLSAAIAALVANGLPIVDAVAEAQEFSHAALTHAQRFGMGKLIPDRYFWTQEPGEAEASP